MQITSAESEKTSQNINDSENEFDTSQDPSGPAERLRATDDDKNRDHEADGCL